MFNPPTTTVKSMTSTGMSSTKANSGIAKQQNPQQTYRFKSQLMAAATKGVPPRQELSTLPQGTVVNKMRQNSGGEG